MQPVLQHPGMLSQCVRLGGYLLGAGLALASPRDVLALTALALVGLAIVLLARGGSAAISAGPLPGRAASLRDKAWSAQAYQRQLDPGTAGRPRPRAPGAVPAAG